jgi:hypothetical protein
MNNPVYLLRSTLKFTLKFLLHVSVEQPSSGSILLILTKVIIIETIGLNTSSWTVRRCGCILCQVLGSMCTVYCAGHRLQYVYGALCRAQTAVCVRCTVQGENE